MSRPKARPDSPQPSAIEVKRAAALAAPLLTWYRKHHRRLPWRIGPDERKPPGAALAYRVWLSEIMLQQTTVATVGPYYARFLERWPDVDALAAAKVEDVLAAWAGLGYYARARNLHACAIAVSRTYKGKFPGTELALLELPGIGGYTAAAIAAIAFDEPAAVMDGNIERVLARVFAITEPLPGIKARLKELARAATPIKHPGDHAQALMDLGATICMPGNPKCNLCPIAAHCAGFAQGIAADLPRKALKKPKPLRHTIAFLLERPDGAILFRRRPSKGLLGGMLEVPSTPWRTENWALKEALAHAPVPESWKLRAGHNQHVFTHFTLSIQALHARVTARRAAQLADKLEGEWLDPRSAPVPTAIRKMLMLDKV